jgi:predicted CXXCH cytochrome family protein
MWIAAGDITKLVLFDKLSAKQSSERCLTLCYCCHQSVEPDFSKPEHHRVNEGLMSCSDCHNPHGSALSHNLRASSTQTAMCTICHVDAAGPFVFE